MEYSTILAIETSAGPVSCALTYKGKIVASAALNTRLTHSQTLLPMVRDMLRNSGAAVEDIDLFAVAAGPGSFTGVRIGVSAVKGMAFPKNTPCAAVSTLAAMARMAEGIPFDGMVCPVMDARCSQVYTASFACEGGRLSRLTPDEAISLAELQNRLLSSKKSVFLVGDGAAMCYTELQGQVPGLFLAPPHLRFQQASGVAAEAAQMALAGRLCSAADLQPAYLRLPQAERELRARQARAEEPGQ